MNKATKYAILIKLKETELTHKRLQGKKKNYLLSHTKEIIKEHLTRDFTLSGKWKTPNERIEEEMEK